MACRSLGQRASLRRFFRHVHMSHTACSPTVRIRSCLSHWPNALRNVEKLARGIFQCLAQAVNSQNRCTRFPGGRKRNGPRNMPGPTNAASAGFLRLSKYMACAAIARASSSPSPGFRLMSMGSKSNLSTKRGLGPLLPNDLLARMTNVWASACSKLNLSGIPSATLWYNFHKNLQTLVCFKPGWNLRLRRPSGAPSWTRLRRALPTLSKSRPAAIHTLRPKNCKLRTGLRGCPAWYVFLGFGLCALASLSESTSHGDDDPDPEDVGIRWARSSSSELQDGSEDVRMRVLLGIGWPEESSSDSVSTPLGNGSCVVLSMAWPLPKNIHSKCESWTSARKSAHCSRHARRSSN